MSRPADPIWAECPLGLLPVRWIASRIGRAPASVFIAARRLGAEPVVPQRVSRGAAVAPDRIWRRLLDAWGLDRTIAWLERYKCGADIETVRLVAAGRWPAGDALRPRPAPRPAPSPRRASCPLPEPITPEPPPPPPAAPLPPVESVEAYLARGGRLRRCVLQNGEWAAL